MVLNISSMFLIIWLDQPRLELSPYRVIAFHLQQMMNVQMQQVLPAPLLIWQERQLMPLPNRHLVPIPIMVYGINLPEMGFTPQFQRLERR